MSPEPEQPAANRGEQRSVLVIGARGALGSLLVDAFAGDGWRVVGAGRGSSPDPAYRSLYLGAREQVRSAIAEFDLVVNAVPDPEVRAERAVLDHGGLLINVSAMPAEPARQLRRQALDPRGTVVMGAGIAPGITNLIAAELIAGHPGADEIELVFTVSTKGTSGPAGAEFAHRGATSRRYHSTVTVPLPEPFGRRRCLGFAERDGGWLGDVAAGRTVSPYVCIAERGIHRVLLALNGAGLIARLPRDAFRPKAGRGPEPSDEPVAHWVAVLDRGQRIAARTLECRGDYASAARSTAVLGDALLADDDGSAFRRGVFSPEDLVSLERLAPGLQAAGVTVVDRSPSGVARTVPAGTIDETRWVKP